MQYRKLGQSDLEVSAITMGGWTISGDSTWGPQDEGDAIAALRTAFDCGINSFDTAVVYGDGRSEELMGRALAGIRSEVIIANKIPPESLGAKDLKASCEASLQRLGTDYVDICYIHWPNWDIPIAETLGAMEELKQEGKVRVIACSNFGPQDLADLLEHGRVEANQVAYNLLWRAIEYEILPVCRSNKVSIVCYSPLLHGLLTGKFHSADEIPWGRTRTRHFSSDRQGSRHGEPGAEEETFEALDQIRSICREADLSMIQVAMAWLLRQEGVATVAVGARHPDQIRANAEAASLNLADDVVAALNQATEPLREKLGTNADLWQGDSRIR